MLTGAKRRTTTTGAALALFALVVPLALAAQGDTILVSRTSDGSQGGNGSSFEPSVSADGRFVGFISNANNLSGADSLDTSDIYVFDAQERTVELVSRESGDGPGGDANSSNVSISASGRFVAFDSVADNLSGGTHTPQNVYVYDRQRNEVELISRKSDGGPGGNSGSSEPSISASGRFVAFESEATNLSVDDAGAFTDIFVYDRRLDQVELVSRNSNGGAGGNEDSQEPAISGDGGVVSFQSAAENLSGADVAYNDIFAYDRDLDQLKLISRRSNQGAGADDMSQSGHSTSDNGRYVAFSTSARNLSGDDVDSAEDVFVYDRGVDKLSLVSRAPGGGPGGDLDSQDPSISGSGRYVAFQSGARNLTGVENEAFADVFVYDRTARTVRLMSRRSNGGPGGDATSGTPAISSNGRFVAFASTADNLPGTYFETFQNIFRHDYLGP